MRIEEERYDMVSHFCERTANNLVKPLMLSVDVLGKTANQINAVPNPLSNI